MTAHDPGMAAAPAVPRRAGRLLGRLLAGTDPIPDRRGEALHIFTTIFIRPGLELYGAIPPIAPQLRLERGASERAAPGAPQRVGWRLLARQTGSFKSTRAPVPAANTNLPPAACANPLF